jgi:hypothetical protein
MTNCTENEAFSTANATPILRLRGGIGEVAIEGQTAEETVGERFILTTLDEEESEAIGGRMEDAKLLGMIRISGCNPNGIKAHQLKSHLQHSMDLQVDIQCYSEVNTYFLQTQQRQKFYEDTKWMNRQARSVWGTSQVVVDNESAFKPGWVSDCNNGTDSRASKEIRCGFYEKMDIPSTGWERRQGYTDSKCISMLQTTNKFERHNCIPSTRNHAE